VGSRDAEQFFQLPAIARRAVRLFAAADEQLELLIAVAANVFVKGHDRFLTDVVCYDAVL
jgi:hypothetical protein